MTQTGDNRRRHRLLISSGLFIAFIGLFLAAGQFVPANYKGSTFKCWVEGPSSSEAEISERAGVVTGYPTILPLGRACQWDRADGDGTITTYSGSWAGTSVAVLLLIGGITVIVRSSRQRPPRNDRRSGP